MSRYYWSTKEGDPPKRKFALRGEGDDDDDDDNYDQRAMRWKRDGENGDERPEKAGKASDDWRKTAPDGHFELG